MSNAKLPNPILVNHPGALHHMAEALLHETIVAVDTESNSLYAYQEQVCLIQFSTAMQDFLVDPLSLDNLTPLGAVFGERGIEKVFHAAEYDLICLKRDFGFEFANLFDTMAAARILGREAVGLGAILDAEFGVQVDKRYQRANWGQRPLPAYLLSYAQVDTRYLIPLRQRLYTELVENELWPLAAEDFTRMINADGRTADSRGEEVWRISGSFDLSPRQAAVLKELCRYRDEAARLSNRPLFKVIGDKTLAAIAAQCPSSLEELAQIDGMTEGQVRRHGNALLAAIERGRSTPPLSPPRNRRPDEQYLERLEALRTWRKNTGKRMGVNSDVVLPRDLLYAIAARNPSGYSDLEAVLCETPWRCEHFGGEILDVVRNPRASEG